MDENRQAASCRTRRVDALLLRRARQRGLQRYDRRSARAPAMGRQSALVPPPRPYFKPERARFRAWPELLHHGRRLAHIDFASVEVDVDGARFVQWHDSLAAAD